MSLDVCLLTCVFKFCFVVLCVYMYKPDRFNSMDLFRHTSPPPTSTLLIAACITGFLGDASLQVISQHQGGSTGFGLKPYFQQHGRAESLFIAAGMLVAFFVLYILIKLPLKPAYIALYAIILDLLFRQLNIFPSLKGYYQHLNYLWSAVWAVIPMLMVYYLAVAWTRRSGAKVSNGNVL